MAADTSPRYKGLDGLRAIAILLVLLFHLTPGRNSDQGLKASLFKLADLGWSGVDLFFALSGFLITTIVLRDKAGGASLRGFMRARVMRIVPAYFLALALAFLVLPAFAPAAEGPSWGEQAPYWLFLANYAFDWPHPQGVSLGLQHFWSLSIEMQFYLAWPFAVRYLAARTVVRIAIAALAFAIAARAAAVAAGVHWPVTYAWTPFRMDALLLGSLAAIAYARGVQLRTGLVVTGLVSATLVAWAFAWFGYAQAPLSGPGNGPRMAAARIVVPLAVDFACFAALWLALHSTRAKNFLGHAAFAPLARYSYGTYIAHFLFLPLFTAWFAPDRLRPWVGSPDAAVYAFFIMASVCSFLVAVVSYHAIEVHFLNRRVAPGLPHASLGRGVP